MATERFLRFPEVSKLTGMKRASVYRLIQQGKFPRQIKLSDNVAAWLEADIVEWMDQKITASRAVQGKGEPA